MLRKLAFWTAASRLEPGVEALEVRPDIMDWKAAMVERLGRNGDASERGKGSERRAGGTTCGLVFMPVGMGE